MADERTDISTKKELSICGRWIENDGCIVERFLGVVHVHEVHAEALTQSFISFHSDKKIPLK